ncbi:MULTISPECIES: helix-turn-helix domain-containing protein [Snodgrassella]|uniref:helix-turn-helix domain-containing protein n=1 Tax=Snodgrassella TaxID=1193515 RepID=UPI000C1E914D|nr:MULTISPECIES: helix-turn-helix transcriptional regulator [Snodgrassella]PIT24253.1 transcriptional regulator [Snodgrassella communis]
MGLTKFGEAVREARRKTKQTLQTMSDKLEVSPAFLSAIETGRNKVPMSFIHKIENFFDELGYPSAAMELKQKAMVSNENVSLDGLSLQQKMLVAGFASSEFNKEQLQKFAELLKTINKDLLKEKNDAGMQS